MMIYWLNVFFRLFGYTSSLKQKIVQSNNWLVVLLYAFLLVITELVFIIVSLPVYIFISPEKIHEKGSVLLQSMKDKTDIRTYTVRRNVSVATSLAVIGVLAIKIIASGTISYFLLGIPQPILADTQDSSFTSSSEYVFNSSTIEVIGGAAQLKDNGGYDKTKPAISPVASLIPSSLASWDSFSETATKNGGEVYYQLSNDNGTTWKYWNGSAWSTATTPSAVDPGLLKITGGGCCGLWPSNLAKVGNKLLFNDYDSTNGTELWKSDGTDSGTSIVKDINPGSNDGQEGILVDINGAAFFSANDGTHGTELWKSDGTESGTKLVKDINPSGDSNLWHIINANGTAFFAADDGTHGMELWKSDGTDSGTMMVDDLNPSGSSNPQNLTYCNNSVYFTGSSSTMGGSLLWKSDGTSGGTVALNLPDMATPNSLFCSGSVLYFTANNMAGSGVELGKTDGTDIGTVLVKDIYPGGNSSYPQNFADINGTLYFSANDGVHGAELWKTDGTESGTVMVKDVNPGIGDSNPAQITNVNGVIYFDASDGIHGMEIWKTDGTDSGTTMVKDVFPGAGDSWAAGFVDIYGTVYFNATNISGGKGGGNKYQLWQTDGTASGTFPVMETNPGGDDNVSNIINISNKLYFTADDPINSTQLWIFGPAAPLTDVNTAAVINSHISTFSTSTGQIKWKAFLASDGTQQVILNHVVVGYTQNQPMFSSVSAVQNIGTSTVTIHYDLNKSATTSLDISSDGGVTWNVATTTLAGDFGVGMIVGTNKTITWNASIDFNTQEKANMRVRLSGVDSSGVTSSYFESTDFSVDTAAPVGLASLSKFSSTASSVTLGWSTSTDAHFNHYELWHGSNENDVNNRTSTAIIWSTSTDANLNNPLTISTVITGINLSNNYFVKIWAIDDFGNETTAPAINVYEAPAPVQKNTTGGGSSVSVDTTPPGKPILNPLTTPTKETVINVSGLAEPQSRVDLYDNGILVSRLNSTADNNGIFSQKFTLSIGKHSLTVRAIDFSNNSSQFSNPIILNIAVTVPTTPIILTPQNNISITNATPQIIGVADANNQIIITIDKKEFIVNSDNNGAWNFTLPSNFALSNGPHSISVVAKDAANNESPVTTQTITKSTVETQVSTPISTIGGNVISLPTPSLLNAVTQATELPGVPVPKVTAAGVSITAGGDVLNFTGTSMPNSDVVVYIHSNQALIYQTRTDQAGNWEINHSQVVSELAPGEHTIYAVALDANSKVKSQPSVVNSFTVQKNFWVTIYKNLNWQTTVATLIVLVMTILWLTYIRRKETKNT